MNIQRQCLATPLGGLTRPRKQLNNSNKHKKIKNPNWQSRAVGNESAKGMNCGLDRGNLAGGDQSQICSQEWWMSIPLTFDTWLLSCVPFLHSTKESNLKLLFLVAKCASVYAGNFSFILFLAST